MILKETSLFHFMEEEGLPVSSKPLPFSLPDPKDGRVKLVVPTKQATEAWEKISRAGRALLDQAYKGVHPAEIETVKRVLEKVRKNLKG